MRFLSSSPGMAGMSARARGEERWAGEAVGCYGARAGWGAYRRAAGGVGVCRASSGLWAASVAAVRGAGEITGGRDEVTDAGHEGLYIHRTCESPKQGQTLLPRVCARTTFSSQPSATLRPPGVCTRTRPVSRLYHSSVLRFSASAIYFVLAFATWSVRKTILGYPTSVYAKCGEQ